MHGGRGGCPYVRASSDCKWLPAGRTGGPGMRTAGRGALRLGRPACASAFRGAYARQMMCVICHVPGSYVEVERDRHDTLHVHEPPPRA
eukprot:11542588-Alexandrium_andersonii.AAC.1